MNSIINWIKSHLTLFAAICLSSAIIILVFVAYITGNLKQPSNNNPLKYGIVRVAIDAKDLSYDWTEHEKEVLKKSLKEVSKLGPDFMLVEIGASDVTIYKTELDCEKEGSGRYFPGTNIIDIDTHCAHNDESLQQSIIHELGHKLKMHHVCLSGQSIPYVDDDLSTCSPTVFGPAVMNTGIEKQFTDISKYNINQYLITKQDIDEFSRVWRLTHKE